MIVGIERATGLAEFDQLFEVVDATGTALGFFRAFD